LAPRRLRILKNVLEKEIAPPHPSEWLHIVREYREFEDVLVRAGVLIEIVLWFFVGEQIGRGNIAGYIVPATYIPKATRKKAAATQIDNPSEF
uniref:ABC transporter ATP-binding protein n=1 Tax=Dracunculus medinensis TaxID=318479 RepID=A0A0N4U9T5_DRAME